MKKVFRSLSILTLAGLTLASVSSCSVFGETYYYKYDSETGGYAVTGLKNYTDNDLEIPSKHKGKKVTKIGDEAFSGWSFIKSFKLPNSIIEIGDNAFRNCDSLKKFTLPSKVKTIGDGAFSECDNLETINVPNSTRYLGDNVFENDLNLKTTTSADGDAIYLGSVLMGLTEQGQTKTTFTVQEGTRFVNSAVFKDNTTIQQVQLYASDENEGVYSIGASAFEGATALNDVKLSKNLLLVGSKSFYGYDFGADYELSLGDGSDYEIIVKSEAFENAKNIKKVSFNNDATIESYAFSGTDTIEDLTFAKNADILESAFAKNDTISASKALKNLTITGEANIGTSAFEGTTLENVNLEKPISIGENAFKDNKQLVGSSTGLKINKTIESFGDFAFAGCTALEEVTIEDGSVAKHLGENIFEGDTSLNKVSLSNTIEQIDYHAFNGCTSLTNINVPTSLKIIGSESFVKTKLSSISFENAKNFESVYEKAFQDCSNLTDVTFNDGVLNVGAGAFQNCNLTTVKLPESCITVGSNAFAGNKNLTTAELSGSMYTVASELFAGDENLTTVKFGSLENATSSSVTRVNSGAFKGCESLLKFAISDDVLVVEDSIFEGCTNLEDVKLPSNITYIPASIFKDCSNLASFTIGANVETIGDSAFEGCTNLKNVEIPDLVTTIGDSAFKDSGLTKLELNNVTSIGAYAFNGCEGVTRVEDIEISDDIEYIGAGAFKDLGLPDNVTSIGNANNRNLILIKYNGTDTNLNVPDDTRIIGEEAVKGNTVIKSVTIGKNVSMLAKGAFEDCTNLETISFAEGSELKNIGEEAFAGCTALETLDLSNSSLEYIDMSAFDSCTNLKTVILPDTLTAIGENAFNNCSSLKTITLGSKVRTIGVTAFADCSALETINLESVIVVENGAFQGCTGLKNVTFGNVIYKIESSAFNGCSSLEAIDLNQNGLISIGDSAFEGCTSAANIELGQYLQTIGNKAFKDCTSVQKVVIPDLCSNIGERAFDSCENMKKVTIGSNVSYVGYNAFVYCEALETVQINFSDIEEEEIIYTETQYLDAVDQIKSITIEAGMSQEDAKIIYDAKNAFLSTDTKQKLKERDDNPVQVVEEAYEELELSGFVINELLGTNNQYARTISDINIFGEAVFEGAEAIKNVVVSGGSAARLLELSYYTEDSNPLYYGASIYVDEVADENKITSIKLDNEIIDKIGSYCLSGWVGESLELNANTSTLKDYAFANAKVKHIELGANVSNIGKEAFVNSGLKELVTSRSLYSITGNVFGKNTKLDYIVFKNNISIITNGANIKVTTVYYEGSEAKWKAVAGSSYISAKFVYNSLGPSTEE